MKERSARLLVSKRILAALGNKAGSEQLPVECAARPGQ